MRFLTLITSTSRENAVEPRLFSGGSDQFQLGIGGRQHEIGNARHDFRTKPRTVEHAVMSDTLLHVMHAAVIRYGRAQRVRGFGLAEAGDVVVLAFDRHQCHA